MTAKSFIDTNIALYTIGQDKHKTEVARGLVATMPFVSAQVINECVSVWLQVTLATANQLMMAFGSCVLTTAQAIECITPEQAESCY
jgi:predicted nucleic acid-binding protein